MQVEKVKEILSDFDYDRLESSEKEDHLEDFQSLAKSYDNDFKELLSEETFDDFDTVFEALRTGLEMEIRNFTSNLLWQNVDMFAWIFVQPSTEVFKDAWKHVLNKFTLRDDASRDQFLERIKILLRSIFIDKIGIKDEQFALDLADAYHKVFQISINQLLDKMKPSEGQETDTAQDSKDEQGNELTYR